MRSEERDPAHLWDMFEAARAVVDFSKNLTLEEFLATGRDRAILRLVVERELEILGGGGTQSHLALPKRAS
ncbi:MAG TPA: hypothetical protein VLK23_08095 [Thermodesulfobacteriota bacterium]|nr:hypothetical protein [Thermodesulfobacteriota bacterium]